MSPSIQPIRVYADTSVFGGVFDAEFAHHSKMFFEQVRMGRFSLVSSTVVRDELIGAPDPVVEFFRSVLTASDIAEIPAPAIELRRAYLAAGIVGPSSVTDALHVALATVLSCRVIISWNFKHIVHLDKISRYNAMNTMQGFGPLAIHTPAEVVSYEQRL